MVRAYDMKIILKYFLSGLVFLVPIILFVQITKSVSGFVGGLIPGTNIFLFVLTFLAITLLGFVVSGFMGGWIKRIFLRFSKNSGVFNFLFKIFTNYKEFSEKTKEAFTRPVYIEISDGIRQIGFITDVGVSTIQDSSDGKTKQVAVYMPQPITFMGDLLFVDSDKLEIIPKEEAKKISLYLFTAGILKK